MALVRACRRFHNRQASSAGIGANRFLQAVAAPRRATLRRIAKCPRGAIGNPNRDPLVFPKTLLATLHVAPAPIRLVAGIADLSSLRFAILDCKPNDLELPVKDLLTDSGNSD
jgi:hypothetical protein